MPSDAPDLPDGWDVHTGHEFVGRAVECPDGDDEQAAGEIVAVWSFRRRTRPRRRRPRGRRPDQHEPRSLHAPVTVRRASDAGGESGSRFKAGPAEHQQEQENALSHPRLTGTKTGRKLDTSSWDAYPHKRSAHRERLRCHEPWRVDRDHTIAVTVRERPSQEQFDMTTSRSLSTAGVDATNAGSTTSSVEEESPTRGDPRPGSEIQKCVIARRSGITHPHHEVPVCVGVFNTLHYCYHSDEGGSDTVTPSATSHVVALTAPVESGGATAHV